LGFWAVNAVAVATVAALAVPAVPAAATSGTLLIGVDTTLTEDHFGAIEFTADGVTLDCAGYTVTGPGSGIGILIFGRSDVVVKGCDVTGFDEGFEVANSSGMLLSGNTANGNDEGFRVATSTDVTLSENTANSNTSWGVILTEGTSKSLLEDNVANDNDKIGFALNTVSDNELRTNQASKNPTSFDVLLSDDNLLDGNSVVGGENGFHFGDSDGNTVTNNEVSMTALGGGFVLNNSSNNTFTGNTSTSNGAQGFHIFLRSMGNTFTENGGHSNTDVGFRDSTTGTGNEGTGNSYSENVCTGNVGGGSSPTGLCQEEQVGLVDITTGLWLLRHSANDVTSFGYGNPNDLPILGDWDGDGDATPGLYRQSDGFFYSRNSNTTGIADAECFAGDPSDVPIAGDWDGDGDDNLGIYRPSEQMFYLFTSTCTGSPMGAAQISFLFGNPGDKPVAGDWDGDGIDEVGLHRESTGFFYWRNTLDTGVASGEIFFGDPGDRFVSGDWGTVDGKDTPGLFRPSDVTFYFRHTLTQGVADSQFTWTGAGSSWLPVAGDFGLG
jgi:parallel beta-helix repeat protein